MSIEQDLMREIIKDSLSKETKERISATLAPKLEKIVVAAIADSFEGYIQDCISELMYEDDQIHEAIKAQVRAAFNLPASTKKGRR